MIFINKTLKSSIKPLNTFLFKCGLPSNRFYSLWNGNNPILFRSLSYPFINADFPQLKPVQKQQFSTTCWLGFKIKEDPPPNREGEKVIMASFKTKPTLKELIRDYGSTVMVLHIFYSLTSLSFCYLAVANSIDIDILVHFFEKFYSASEKYTEILANGSTFGIAYVIHKLFMPLRIGLTISTAPILVNKLRQKGILKPMKKK